MSRKEIKTLIQSGYLLEKFYKDQTDDAVENYYQLKQTIASTLVDLHAMIEKYEEELL